VIRELCCAAALVPALFGACGGEDAPVGEGAGESTTPALAPDQAPRVITEADAGSTVMLPVGGETSLRLSSDYVWNEPAVRGEAVQLARVDYIQDPGFSEWVVTAVAPGKATILAAGEPACSGQEGCDSTALVVRVTISVST
jgi:predicted secreted protein